METISSIVILKKFQIAKNDMQIKKVIYMLHFRNFFVTRGKKPTKPDICNDMGQKHIYFEGLCEDNFTTSITI